LKAAKVTLSSNLALVDLHMCKVFIRIMGSMEAFLEKQCPPLSTNDKGPVCVSQQFYQHRYQYVHRTMKAACLHIQIFEAHPSLDQLATHKLKEPKCIQAREVSVTRVHHICTVTHSRSQNIMMRACEFIFQMSPSSGTITFDKWIWDLIPKKSNGFVS